MKTSRLSDSQPSSFRRKGVQQSAADSEDEHTRAGGRPDGGRRTHLLPRIRTQQQTDDSDEEMLVDVEANVEDTRFLPVPPAQSADVDDVTSHPSSRTIVTSRKTPRSGPSMKWPDPTDADADKYKRPSKKPKRTVVVSDDEDRDDTSDHRPRDIEEPEEDYVPSPPETKGKAAAVAGARGRAVPSGGSKVRNKIHKDSRPILVKDERKLPLKEEQSITQGSKRSRLDVEMADSNEDKPGSPASGSGTSYPPNEPSVASEKEPEPAQKKRKLPPIRKNKTTGSTSATTAKQSQATTEGGKDKDKSLSTSAPPPPIPGTLPRKPALTAGNADLDLTNKDVYKQLFSQGNAPPRSGIKEKEERIRQLSKMRDEARARRAEEARDSFDLQAQNDKIAYFSKRLEGRKSPAMWPNTLAAKFKADYEDKLRLEGRARRTQEHHHHHRQSGQQNGSTTSNGRR